VTQAYVSYTPELIGGARCQLNRLNGQELRKQTPPHKLHGCGVHFTHKIARVGLRKTKLNASWLAKNRTRHGFRE